MANARKRCVPYMCVTSEEKASILKQLAQGLFHVPRSQQTWLQKSTVRQFEKRRDKFQVTEGVLYFDGKKVVPKTNVGCVAKKCFKDNLGAGARSTWHQVTQTCTGVSRDSVEGVVKKRPEYHKAYPIFDNRLSPKPIVTDKVNEQWQVDLIDMRSDQVRFHGLSFRYILSIIDTFSRLLFLRPTAKKTSVNVASALTRVFADHGNPSIIQCDQGTEFKGKVEELLRRLNVRVIRSRPYHPQPQSKCEQSHREVKGMIRYKMRKRGGFNWARNLHEIQKAINDIPKAVIANRSPLDVYAQRGNEAICKEARKASTRANERLKKKSKRQTSVYRSGERVLIRYPSRNSKRIPRRRHVYSAVVVDADIAHNKYLVRFRAEGGKDTREWVSVVDIKSSTAHKRTKKQTSQRRKLHREKFVIPMTHKDNVNSIASSGINVLLDPKEVRGSCQFEAISHQLSLFGIHRTPLALRQEAVEHLENHFELYLNFIPGEVVFDKLQYIKNMKNEHTFGDHVTLLAVSRCYNVQILIASPASLDHTVLVSPDGKYRPDNFLLTLGHFPEEKGEHYISVGMCADNKKELLFHATYDGRSGSDDRDQTGSDDRDQTGNGHNGQTGRYDREQIDSDDRDHFESDVTDHVDSDDREQFDSDDRDQTGRDDRDQTGRDDRDQTGRDDRDQTGRDDRDQTGNGHNEEYLPREIQEIIIIARNFPVQ